MPFPAPSGHFIGDNFPGCPQKPALSPTLTLAYPPLSPALETDHTSTASVRPDAHSTPATLNLSCDLSASVHYSMHWNLAQGPGHWKHPVNKCPPKPLSQASSWCLHASCMTIYPLFLSPPQGQLLRDKLSAKTPIPWVVQGIPQAQNSASPAHWLFFLLSLCAKWLWFRSTFCTNSTLHCLQEEDHG